jgi:hypothetical protein
LSIRQKNSVLCNDEEKNTDVCKNASGGAKELKPEEK